MKETRSSGSKWEAVRRCLVILRQLQRYPADRKTLMRAVRELLPDAYRTGTADAQRRAFERDLENLRGPIKADVDWDGTVYKLIDVGPYAGFDLSDESLTGLAFLTESFGPESGGSELVRPFLNELLSILPSDRQRQLEGTNATLRLNLRRLDSGEIAPVVWEKVGRALNRWVLRFKYSRSKNKNPDDVRIHTVEPYVRRFHRGHYELKAYCRHWRNAQGQGRHDAGWLRYRLDRILAEDIETLSNRISRGQRQRRLMSVRYLISPKLAEGGVSKHFEEMVVGEPNAKGWIEVTGKTDDLFEAKRIFLAYGEHCIVLEPSDLAYEMKQIAQKVVNLYENPPDS